MNFKNCCCQYGKKLQNKPIKTSFYFIYLNLILGPILSLKFGTKINSILSSISLILIGFYRSVLTAHMGAGACRFEPTCSKYANEAFLQYPFFIALKLTFMRFIKCRPGSSFGYDPVPIPQHHQFNTCMENLHELK